MYSDPWGLCGSPAPQDGASVAVLDANKKKFCDQLAQLLKDGRLSEEKFKKLYAGSKCGQTVSSEISSGYWGGFWKGAHDGYIQTSASALNVLTFGVFGIEDMPTEYGWLYDPDLPELLASKYAGRVAGTALAIVLPARFAGFGNSATVVTRWGRPGLRSGDWVMTGGKTWFNYLRSGKFQPGLGNQFAKFGSGRTFTVPAGSVQWPRGFGVDGWLKGLFGQRRYYGPPL